MYVVVHFFLWLVGTEQKSTEKLNNIFFLFTVDMTANRSILAYLSRGWITILDRSFQGLSCGNWCHFYETMLFIAWFHINISPLLTSSLFRIWKKKVTGSPEVPFTSKFGANCCFNYYYYLANLSWQLALSSWKWRVSLEVQIIIIV